MTDFDLVVFGGGNSFELVLEAGRAGMRTALIEEGPLGGTCPNRGCIPSKLLIGHADVAQAVRESGRFHVASRIDAIDGVRILAETFAQTRKTDAKLEQALPASVTLFRGRGEFRDDKTVRVGPADVRGRTVVLATGSRPRTPPVPAWTSDDVFRLERAPESIAIVGGGYIGCELAHFFHGIGTETTLLNRSGTLLPNEDEEVRAVFQAGFTARIPTRLNAEVSAVEGRRIRLADGATLEAEAVLFAIGRVPNTDGIGIERTMIRLTETGHVRVDEFLGTGMEGVHAMGDVVGRHPFTHAASWEAQYLAGRIVHGRTEPLDYGPVPHAVFSHPQVAGVGATEQELRARGTAHLKASVPYRSAAKGRAVKEEHGLCKFLLDPLGKILGCHIVGHEASTLLHEVIPVMKWRNHISSLTEIIHVHPSLPEVIRNAARKARDLVPRRE